LTGAAERRNRARRGNVHKFHVTNNKKMKLMSVKSDNILRKT